MKKLIIVFAMFFASSFTSAELSPSEARWNLVKKTGGFAAGFASGMVFHELGHQVVASLEGEDIKWSGEQWYVPHVSRSALRNMSVGGFGAQVLSTEIILRTYMLPKSDSYFLGWLTHNIVNQIYYPIKNERSSSGYKDLATFKNNGGNVKVLEVGLVAHALWSAYRLYHDPDTPFFIQTTRDEVRVGLGWEF